MSACCGPAGTGEAAAADRHMARALAVAPAPADIRAGLLAALRPVPGGIFEMGARRSTYPADLDSPRRKVRVGAFRIAPMAVTNDGYARFAAATGYASVAETEGWSFVFHLALRQPAAHPQSPLGLPWWRRVEGACWHAPEGPGSSTAGRGDHPAVHLAWQDAQAYCRWAGLRLPTEAEWERAARGGLARQKFPWGNTLLPGGAAAMNTFEGRFPDAPAAGADWRGTVPAGAFAPNGYGLYNMTGNVWEWVEDRFGPLPDASPLPARDPAGAATGTARVQRGGSHLCHASYCDRYHVHSRTRNDPDSTTGHAGFRVAADP